MRNDIEGVKLRRHLRGPRLRCGAVRRGELILRLEQRRVLVRGRVCLVLLLPWPDEHRAAGCSEHADCGSDEYCYDTGYIMTGEWNGVGSCDYHLPNCCGGAVGDPIDRDIGNCPAASQCESETATASNCEDICQDHGYNEAQCVAVSSSCAWNNGACGSYFPGVGSASCSLANRTPRLWLLRARRLRLGRVLLRHRIYHDRRRVTTQRRVL